MAPHYIITVSEGRFRVLERFARPGQITPTLREIASHDFLPAASAYSAREINQIGHGSTNLLRHVVQGGGTAPAQDDEHRRTVDWLAEQIEHFLIARPGQAWAFAAGPNLHDQILDRIRPSVRGSLVETVRKNLALTPPAELATHSRVRA
jgi:hypothetical protein